MNSVMPLLWKIKIFFVLSFLLLISCQKPEQRSPDIDLKEIKERGKIIAITGYSATSYFIYKGQPMGYQYDLLTRLADHLNLELEIVIENNLERLIERLNEGDGDLIAYDLTITSQRKQKVKFTDYLFTTRQVLVQRKPDNWRRMKRHEINNVLIRTPIELINKTIYVKEASSYSERLKNLSEEIGGHINIVEVQGDTTTEQLIQAVAEGRIDYTVADQHIAMINQAYFRNLDIKTAISLPQRIAWAVRKTSPELHGAINKWLDQMKKKDVYYVIYNKYFKNRQAFVRRVKSEYLSVTGGKISAYDKFIQEQAEILDWDWRLLASLIYEESRFNPGARSWSGAVGIMQILPATAKEFGIKNLKDPYQNIKAGVMYLEWLSDYWKQHIEERDVCIKFILASYNVGIGHVQDARRLAEKYGKDPDKWDGNVAYYILRLSQKKYFTDEVVEFGYCRGLEPYNYVNEIFYIYKHYQKFISLSD